MSCRAVLFDLDGTLLDTIQDLADSMNAVLASLGLPGHAVAAYKRFVGDGVANLVRRALPEDRRDEQTVARGVAEMRRQYARRWADTTRPYEGIPELLDALSARGVPLAVLSNKPEDFTRMMVERLLGRWRFAAVRGARDGQPLKPDPAAALAIARQLGSTPAGATRGEGEVPAASDILYLGDSGTDMRTAVAAGMFPVGALWGFRPAEELRACGARALLARPTELLGLL